MLSQIINIMEEQRRQKSRSHAVSVDRDDHDFKTEEDAAARSNVYRSAGGLSTDAVHRYVHMSSQATVAGEGNNKLQMHQQQHTSWPMYGPVLGQLRNFDTDDFNRRRDQWNSNSAYVAATAGSKLYHGFRNEDAVLGLEYERRVRSRQEISSSPSSTTAALFMPSSVQDSNDLETMSISARTLRPSGGKDRHSKVYTAKGPRDRRVRLSVSTAIQFYDVQDRLGFDQPSKAVEWLMNKAKAAIDELSLIPLPGIDRLPSSSSSSSSSHSHSPSSSSSSSSSSAASSSATCTPLIFGPHNKSLLSLSHDMDNTTTTSTSIQNDKDQILLHEESLRARHNFHSYIIHQQHQLQHQWHHHQQQHQQQKHHHDLQNSESALQLQQQQQYQQQQFRQILQMPPSSTSTTAAGVSTSTSYPFSTISTSSNYTLHSPSHHNELFLNYQRQQQHYQHQQYPQQQTFIMDPSSSLIDEDVDLKPPLMH